MTTIPFNSYFNLRNQSSKAVPRTRHLSSAGRMTPYPHLSFGRCSDKALAQVKHNQFALIRFHYSWSYWHWPLTTAANTFSPLLSRSTSETCADSLPDADAFGLNACCKSWSAAFSESGFPLCKMGAGRGSKAVVGCPDEVWQRFGCGAAPKPSTYTAWCCHPKSISSISFDCSPLSGWLEESMGLS